MQIPESWIEALLTLTLNYLCFDDSGMPLSLGPKHLLHIMLRGSGHAIGETGKESNPRLPNLLELLQQENLSLVVYRGFYFSWSLLLVLDTIWGQTCIMRAFFPIKKRKLENGRKKRLDSSWLHFL